MRLQLTVAILKPDLLARPVAAEAARQRIVESGLLVVRSRLARWTTEEARLFYKQHRGRFFFDRLVASMSSGTLNGLILAGEGAIKQWRHLIGPTKITIARLRSPHSLRGQFGLTDTRNSFHGSGSEAEVSRELDILFPEFTTDQWRMEEKAFRNGLYHYDPQHGVHRATRPLS